MAFAQVTYRESLRDSQACLRAAGNKLYHLGLRAKLARSSPADANEAHHGRIYAGFALPALLIAELCKRHRQVELLFRCIQQHLRIKVFYGSSENAVITQIWIAVSV
jgi:hypothetical protein